MKLFTIIRKFSLFPRAPSNISISASSARIIITWDSFVSKFLIFLFIVIEHRFHWYLIFSYERHPEFSSIFESSLRNHLMKRFSIFRSVPIHNRFYIFYCASITIVVGVFLSCVWSSIWKYIYNDIYWIHVRYLCIIYHNYKSG